MDRDEKNIAMGYMRAPGNHDYKIELTTKRLIVYFGREKQEFILELVRKLSFTHRKLLLPILFSGIFTPLIVLGYFRDYIHPMFAIVLVVTGVFAFYYGWLGQLALSIHHSSGHQDFPLEQISEDMDRFVIFINQYISGKSGNYRLIYSLIQEKSKSGGLEVKYYTYDQLRAYSNLNLLPEEIEVLVIDPAKLDRHVNLVLSQEGNFLEMKEPGSLNKDSIIKRLKGKDLVEFFPPSDR